MEILQDLEKTLRMGIILGTLVASAGGLTAGYTVYKHDKKEIVADERLHDEIRSEIALGVSGLTMSATFVLPYLGLHLYNLNKQRQKFN